MGAARLAPAADGFEAVLAAALIGADRAPPGSADETFADLVPSGDAGGALLARLAAQGVHHLAGTGLAADALAPTPPREPDGPPCPPAAATRLALLLAAGPSARESLREWCRLAGEAALRAPAWLLPALAPHRDAWPAEIEAIAGPELSWLAGALGEASPETSSAESDWTEGGPAERRAAFGALRRHDPEAARAALEAAFRAEKAEMREALVSILEIGLSQADEPFLETCLDDRALGVRAAAQRLLTGLPGSRLERRMAGRVQAALRLTTTRKLLGGARHDLAVELPQESPDLARDGIAPNPYASRKTGPGADMLGQVLKVAPLSAYAGHPPRVWVEAALRSDWSEPILAGMVAALRREHERDPAWRDALIGTLREACAQRLSGVKPTPETRTALARATATLPPAEWEEAVAAVLRGNDVEIALQILEDGPATFSERFTAALFDWLAATIRGQAAGREALDRSPFLARSAYRAHPSADSEAAAAALLARLPDGAHEYLRRRLTVLGDTLSLRTTMRREFSS